jgi:hypothetical protein
VFVCWSPFLLCLWQARNCFYFASVVCCVWFGEGKFCLKCGNCSFQVDGVLMIYCVEIEQSSADFGGVLFSKFCIFGV